MHVLAKLDITLSSIDFATALSGSYNARPQARLAQLAQACRHCELDSMLDDFAEEFPESVMRWKPPFRQMGYYRAYLFDDGSMLEIATSTVTLYQF